MLLFFFTLFTALYMKGRYIIMSKEKRKFTISDDAVTFGVAMMQCIATVLFVMDRKEKSFKNRKDEEK